MEILSVTATTLRFLRENIIMGNFKPGERLNENDISNSINISRQPLREAFRLLENEHLVTNIPRKGTYVNELSVKDFMDISQIREMVECYAVDLLQSARINDIPNVKRALDAAMALPPIESQKDPLQLLKRIEILLGFHKVFVESAGNSRLITLYQSNSYNLARYQFLYFQTEGTERHSLEDHQKILNFIKKGEYEKAKEQLKKHIAYTREIVNKVLATKLPNVNSIL